MQISIINVVNQTVPTKNGSSYQALEVTYKEVQGGKTGTRKIMSFVNDSKPAFEALSGASYGEVFDVAMVKQAGKDGKEYWVWTNAAKGVTNAVGTSTGTVPQTVGTSTTTKGNWETSEERAKKQIYIIRQSSISNAISALAVGSKSAPKPEDVLQLAKRFEEYVFDGLTGNFAEDTKSLEDEDLFQNLPQ